MSDADMTEHDHHDTGKNDEPQKEDMHPGDPEKMKDEPVDVVILPGAPDKDTEPLTGV